MLPEKPQSLKRAFELLTELPDNFLAGDRLDTPPQRRDSL
jgi:hypothetical protein